MQTTNAGPVLTIINNFCEIYANRVILPDQCRNQLQKKTEVPLQERRFLWSTQDSSVCAVERKENAQLPSGVSADGWADTSWCLRNICNSRGLSVARPLQQTSTQLSNYSVQVDFSFTLKQSNSVLNWFSSWNKNQDISDLMSFYFHNHC